MDILRIKKITTLDQFISNKLSNHINNTSHRTPLLNATTRLGKAVFTALLTLFQKA